MAERILVNTEEIMTTVSQYESARDSKNASLSAMKSAVDSLDATWDGPASEAFVNVFNALHSNLNASDQIMEDAITELKNVANAAEELESNNSQAHSSLETGEAFSF